MFTKPEQNRMQGLTTPKPDELSPNSHDPTEPASGPADWFAIRAHIPSHGEETQVELDMDRSTGDKPASCQAKIYNLIHPWFSTDLSWLKPSIRS